MTDRFFPTRLSRATVLIAAGLLLSSCAVPGAFDRGAPEAAGAAPTALTYADAATLALAAPVIVDLTPRRAVPIDPSRAPGLPAGHARHYIEADVNSLLRGEGGVPAALSFLADLPAGAPRPDGRRYLAFARPVAGQPGAIQLLDADSLVGWTPDNDAVVRQATREAVAINAPPAIARIGQAFHFPGQVEGEGETQIFLETEAGDPVSLRVVSAPGAPRRWGVSLGELVDARLNPPPSDSLLWYRLACGPLPARLPEASIAPRDPATIAKLRSDYQFVRAELGPCLRNLR